MLLFILSACEVLTPYLEEVREPPTEVLYGGSVLQGAPISENVLLETGAVTFFDLSGEVLAEAEQPYPSNLGYWRASLPVSKAYALRIEAEDSYPSVWRATTPDQTGLWFTGALFSWPYAQVDPFFESLSESLSLEIADLKTEDVVHLWGQVLNPEVATIGDWLVRDADGKRPEVYGFAIQEDGALVQTEVAPIHYFFAFNLSPGNIEVAGVNYIAEAGDLITAWWYEVLE
jgi:hypothetical protein